MPRIPSHHVQGLLPGLDEVPAEYTVEVMRALVLGEEGQNLENDREQLLDRHTAAAVHFVLV